MKKLGTYLILAGAGIMLLIMLFQDPYGTFEPQDKWNLFRRVFFMLDFWYILILLMTSITDVTVKWKDSQLFIIVNTIMVIVSMVLWVRPLCYFIENYQFIENLSMWWSYMLATFIAFAGGVVGSIRISKKQM